MTTSNLELGRMGGRVGFTLGQLITQVDMERMGDIALQSLCHFLALLFYDEDNGLPQSGFPRESVGSDHCLVTATGDLAYSVSPGWGMIFIPSALASDEWAPASYRPIVVASTATGSLAAHHATLPRIDVVSLAPVWTPDLSEIRHVKSPSTGALGTTAAAQRRRFGYTLTVTAGTPAASPSAPATPAGHIKIAEAEVPATSGAAVWRDCRPMIEFGHLFKGAPQDLYHIPFVPQGESNELLVSADVPTSMNVRVSRGRAVIQGLTRHHPRQRLTIAAANGALPRIDIVEARRDGTLAVVTGTPAASPVAPASTTNGMVLAEIAVAAGATTITSGNITDRRRRTPHSGALIREATIAQSKFALTTERRWFGVGGGAFTQAPGDSTSVVDPGAANGRFVLDNGTSAVVRARAPIQLPHGATVTALRMTLDVDVEAGTSASLQLMRISHTTGVADTLATAVYAGGTGVVTADDTTISNGTVDNENYAYMLFASLLKASLNDLALVSARVAVDTTEIFS